MKREIRRERRVFCLGLLIVLALLFTPVLTKDVQAAKAGFRTINGKTYYITSSGAKKKGWLTLNGKKYYFNKKTGVQLKGWQKDSKGKNIRYFTKGKGVMVTGFLKSKTVTRYFKPSNGKMVRGWLTLKGRKYYFTSGSGAMVKGWLKNSKGEKRYFKSNGVMLTGWFTDSKKNTRYFDPGTGYMATGLKTVGGSIYYFTKSSGIRYQKGFGTVGSKHYYFSPSDGKAHTGWLKLDGKSYYFSSSGVMYMNTTATLGGKTYTFDAKGVASEKTNSSNGNNSSTVFTWFDGKHGRNFTIMNQFKTHPGVADGTKSDLDILAALCESEAGDQGIEGMKAVALCILNRTLDEDFPSSVRYVIYEGSTKFAQYSVVTNGSLQKRLNGVFEDRESAYAAAQQALNSFSAYLANGTPRTVSGMKTKDFKYKYFMMTSAFWNQSLNFKKVVYETYKGHTFFVDWV